MVPTRWVSALTMLLRSELFSAIKSRGGVSSLKTMLKHKSWSQFTPSISFWDFFDNLLKGSVWCPTLTSDMSLRSIEVVPILKGSKIKFQLLIENVLEISSFTSRSSCTAIFKASTQGFIRKIVNLQIVCVELIKSSVGLEAKHVFVTNLDQHDSFFKHWHWILDRFWSFQYI